MEQRARQQRETQGGRVGICPSVGNEQVREGNQRNDQSKKTWTKSGWLLVMNKIILDEWLDQRESLEPDLALHQRASGVSTTKEEKRSGRLRGQGVTNRRSLHWACSLGLDVFDR
jgi:hypothetical protein